MHSAGDPNRARETERRPRILVIGPTGGTTGGVAMFTDILLASRLADRFELIHLDTSRGRAGEGKASSLAPINFLYFIRQFLRLLWILISRRPVVLHQPITSRISLWKEASFMILGRLFGARVIGHLHGGHIRPHLDATWGPGRAMLRALLRLPHRYVTLSQGWRDFLLESVSPNLRIEVIPITVEPRIATMELAQVERSVGYTVLCIGRLEIRKGILDAIAAVQIAHAKTPALHMVWAGGPGPRDEQPRINEACGRASSERYASFPGIVKGAEKERLLREVNLFLLPSHYENLPTVVLEAMAAGLPLVVTRVGALPEYLEEGQHCLFVEPGDPQALGEALVRLAGDLELRRSMGEANRALFLERFHPDIVLESVGKLYEQMAGRG
jgi:glycosyltransferase involved in cell wall biosynthesis